MLFSSPQRKHINELDTHIRRNSYIKKQTDKTYDKEVGKTIKYHKDYYHLLNLVIVR